MKKLAFMGFILIIGLLVGCGDSTSSSEENSSNSNGDDEIVFGVSMLNMGNENIVKISEGMEEKAEELGIKLNITDAQKSADKQLQQIDNFIAQGVDAIILNPVETEASSPAVERAKEAGIPIINVNGETSVEPDAFVGSRDEESAEIAIDFIADQLNEEGNFVMMHGHPGQTAEVKRSNGTYERLKEYPNLNLLAEQTANWSREEGLSLMENWLLSYQGEINAVFAQNDEMGMGALNALEDAGVKDEIVLVSIDAIPDALQAVKDGRLDATVFQDALGQGSGSVETAFKIVNGEDYETEVFIPFQLVTQDNVDEFLE